eukprot:198347-Amphidinium_carterae.1
MPCNSLQRAAEAILTLCRKRPEGWVSPPIEFAAESCRGDCDHLLWVEWASDVLLEDSTMISGSQGFCAFPVD